MPKYQNILLESNFNENPIFMTKDEMKKSLINKTVFGVSKKNSINQKNNMLNSNFNMKRTNSFVRSSAKGAIKQDHMTIM